MRVSVLLFSSYAEALGKSSLSLELPPGSRVRDLLQIVHEMAGPHSLPTALLALNQSYARLDDLVHAEDEIAIIPPVAGG